MKTTRQRAEFKPRFKPKINPKIKPGTVLSGEMCSVLPHTLPLSYTAHPTNIGCLLIFMLQSEN